MMCKWCAVQVHVPVWMWPLACFTPWGSLRAVVCLDNTICIALANRIQKPCVTLKQAPFATCMLVSALSGNEPQHCHHWLFLLAPALGWTVTCRFVIYFALCSDVLPAQQGTFCCSVCCGAAEYVVGEQCYRVWHSTAVCRHVAQVLILHRHDKGKTSKKR